MKKSKSSLQKKFLTVFVTICLILGITSANNLLINSWFTSKIGESYEQNAQLYALVESLAATDRDCREYLMSKSDVSLESYYRNADNLVASAAVLNRAVYSDETALMERGVALLIDSYLDAGRAAIQAKRARDIEQQSSALARSEKMYQYIVQSVGELESQWFRQNYAYYTEMAGRIRVMMMVGVAVFVLVMIGSLCFLVYFLRESTRPLVSLSQVSDAVSQGNYEIPPLYIDTDDEVEVLGNAFNNMLQSIRQNMEQIEEKNRQEIQYRKNEFEMQSHLQQARLKSLQEQVNPHFLFNCLNTAAQLAMLEGADKACRFMEDLSEFYRYNLKSADKDIPLANELESVYKYVDIMRFRFGDMFSFCADVDETLLGLRIPSLILQPIVENAFNHGIRDLESDGEICLSIQRQDGFAHICVRDNGQGFTPAQLEELPLLWQSGAAPLNAQNIGMGNVGRRIELYYKGTGRYTIANRADGPGAAVSIHIPIEEEPDNRHE